MSDPTTLKNIPGVPVYGPGDPVELQRMFDRVSHRLLGTRESGPLPQLQVGRYILRELLGRGARGVVYRAYDPELERDVAIKLLHSRRSGDDDSVASLNRLLHEARAAAALTHPNVVAIHDVGTVPSESLLPGLALGDDRGCAYVVMELVEGESIREWLERGPHETGEILRVFREAGRGISAAHERGLVHRDIKPANIMLGLDGRVRVADFGLARWTGDTGVTVNSRLQPSSSSSELSRTGVVAGTPAYMAPEQHAGHSSDPRVDQFGFATSLYEALHGVRPFPGRDLFELACAKQQKSFTRPASPRRLPRKVERALERALSPDPRDRFTSMDELVAALDYNPQRRRRLVLVPGVAAVLVAAAVGGATLKRQAQLACCEAEARAVHLKWDAETQRALRGALERSGPGFVEENWRRVRAELDGWSESWSEARSRSCSRDSERARAMTSACLDDQLIEFDSLVSVFSEGQDPSTSRLVIDAMAALPDPEDCLDPSYAESSAERNCQGPRGQRILRTLRQSGALLQAGRVEPAAEHARRLLDDPSLNDCPAMHAEALLQLGGVERRRHEQHATDVLRRGFALAATIDDVDLAFRGALSLAGNATYTQRYDIAEHWLAVASIYLDRMGGPEIPQTRYLVTRLRLTRSRGDYVAVARELSYIKKLAANSYGTSHPHYFRLLEVEAETQKALGNTETALALFEHIVVAYTEFYGGSHPATLGLRDGVARVHRDLGHYEVAKDMSREIVETAERVSGRDQNYAALLNNYALALKAAGDPERAIEVMSDVAELKRELHGGESRQYLGAQINLGIQMMEVGAYLEARAMLQAAVAPLETRLDPDAIELIAGHASLGYIRGKLGEHEAAITELGEIATSVERLQGPQSPMLAELLNAISDSQCAIERYADCLATRQRLIEQFAANQGPEHPKFLRYQARAAVAAYRNGSRAEGLARLRQAITATDNLGDAAPAQQQVDMRAWLLELLLAQRRASSRELANLANFIAARLDETPAAHDRARLLVLVAQARVRSGEPRRSVAGLAREAKALADTLPPALAKGVEAELGRLRRL